MSALVFPPVDAECKGVYAGAGWPELNYEYKCGSLEACLSMSSVRGLSKGDLIQSVLPLFNTQSLSVRMCNTYCLLKILVCSVDITRGFRSRCLRIGHSMSNFWREAGLLSGKLSRTSSLSKTLKHWYGMCEPRVADGRNWQSDSDLLLV